MVDLIHHKVYQFRKRITDSTKKGKDMTAKPSHLSPILLINTISGYSEYIYCCFKTVGTLFYSSDFFVIIDPRKPAGSLTS